MQLKKNYMKDIFIIIFLLLTINLVAQDSCYYRYNELIKKAENNQKQGDTKKALDNYDNAFKFINFAPWGYSAAFSAAISDSNFYKANEYLKLGVTKGLNLSYLSSSEIIAFNKSKYASEFWRHKDSLLNVFYNSIDTIYINSINEIFKLDQSTRGYDRIEEEINDSICFDRIIALTESKGFATLKKTGLANNTVTVILFHNGNNGYPYSNQWKKIIPFIKKEIYDGTLDPNFLKDLEISFRKFNIIK